MKILVSIFLMIQSLLGFGQFKERALVSAGGHQFKSGELWFESSTGETFSGYFATANLQFLVGFHQPITITAGGITNIPLINRLSEIKAYPNPTKEYINIALTDQQSSFLQSLLITDIRGVMVNRFQGNEIKANPVTLFISDLDPGIYFMQLHFIDNTKEIIKISIVK